MQASSQSPLCSVMKNTEQPCNSDVQANSTGKIVPLHNPALERPVLSSIGYEVVQGDSFSSCTESPIAILLGVGIEIARSSKTIVEVDYLFLAQSTNERKVVEST